MRIAAIQSFLQPGARAENIDRACLQARQAIRERQPHLLVFPEAFSGYITNSGSLVGETLSGETVRAMQTLAGEGNCLILFGMLRQETDGLHNSAILVDRGGIRGIYDKTHLFYWPSVPSLNEQANVVRGASLGLFDTDHGRIGVMICHDGTYPELVRTLVLQGAQVICWLLNAGNHISWAQHYSTWFLVPIVLANVVVWPAVNIAGGATYRPVGASVIVDGDGRILTQAAEDTPAILQAELDLGKWRDVRANGEGLQAVYRVRRPGLYGPLVVPIPPVDVDS